MTLSVAAVIRWLALWGSPLFPVRAAARGDVKGRPNFRGIRTRQKSLHDKSVRPPLRALTVGVFRWRRIALRRREAPICFGPPPPEKEEARHGRQIRSGVIRAGAGRIHDPRILLPQQYQPPHLPSTARR